MSETEEKKQRGRPPKADGDTYSHYVYVRMSSDQWETIERLAAVNGFKGRGKISATVRWMIERMGALNARKK